MCAEPTSLNCNEIIYRVVLRKTQIDTSKTPPIPTVDNFIRRPGDDDDGLSAGIASRCTPRDVAAKFNKVHAMTSLHVGRIKDLGLDVVIDPEDETHALIVGLPDGDEFDEAETIARAIIRNARPVNWQN
jgi:hypothetical protein